MTEANAWYISLTSSYEELKGRLLLAKTYWLRTLKFSLIHAGQLMIKTLRVFLNTMLLPFFQEDLVEAGCDEAGRGCLAGPVFAAAVILPKDFYHPLLNDSKQITEEQRNELRPVIEQQSLAFAVAQLDHKQIDKLNILKASFKAMHLAVKKLQAQPGLLLVDGNRFSPFKRLPHQCIVGGDGKYASIAAASVLAKTYRDGFMKELHGKYPRYNWAQNKGYATKEHQAALDKYGPCRYHRKSFRLDYSQPRLFTMPSSVNDLSFNGEVAASAE